MGMFIFASLHACNFLPPIWTQPVYKTKDMYIQVIVQIATQLDSQFACHAMQSAFSTLTPNHPVYLFTHLKQTKFSSAERARATCNTKGETTIAKKPSQSIRIWQVHQSTFASLIVLRITAAQRDGGRPDAFAGASARQGGRSVIMYARNRRVTRGKHPGHRS